MLGYRWISARYPGRFRSVSALLPVPIFRAFMGAQSPGIEVGPAAGGALEQGLFGVVLFDDFRFEHQRMAVATSHGGKFPY